MPSPSWPALKKLHDHFARTAIAICNKGDEVAQQLFLVSPNEAGEPVKMAVMPPQMMRRFYGDDHGKDMFAEFLKAMLTEGHPIRQTFVEQMGFEPTVLVQICEAWAHQPKPGEPADDYVTGKKRVSQSPDRTEVVLVTLHLREGSVPVMHRIESHPHRHCVMGDFPRQQDVPYFGGRFAMQDAFKSDNPMH